MKLRGLAGKWVLRRLGRGLVPRAVLDRPKIPYRSPPARVLTGAAAPGWARDLLSPESVRQVGVFDPDKVNRLLAKVAAPVGPLSELDAMGLTAVATGQLLARALKEAAADARGADRVKLEVL
jgi:asparagine synthase (glutamine-hydrolysing)